MRPARRLVAAATALIAFAVALATAELAIRLVRPQAVLLVERGLYAPDPPRRYRLAPGFRGRITNRVEFDTRVAINGAGTRGPELTTPVSAREARGRAERAGSGGPALLASAGGRGGAPPVLLALGDSFAFGVGVEDDEAWPMVLARGLGAEGVNAGTPGFGVPDAVDWFEAHGLALAPSIATLAVFLGNDLQDATPGVPRVVERDGALVVEGQAARSNFRRWLFEHSHLFVLAKDGTGWERLRRALGRGESWSRAEQRREMTLFADETAFAAGAAATDSALERFARLARMHGVRPVVALVPALPQVDEPLWRATAASLDLDPAALDRDRPTRRLAALCRDRGLEVVDLTPALRAATGRGEVMYFPIDRHLTPHGHSVAAAELARAL